MSEEGSAPQREPAEEPLALTVTCWLARHGLARYAAHFRDHATVADLACACYPNAVSGDAPAAAEKALKERYGISALGTRRKLATWLQGWAPCVLFRAETPQRKASSGVLAARALSGGQLLFRTASGAPPPAPPPSKPKRSRSAPIARGTKAPGDAQRAAVDGGDSERKDGPMVGGADGESKKRPLHPIFAKGYRPPAAAQKRPRNAGLLTAPKSGQRLFRAPAPPAGSGVGRATGAGAGQGGASDDAGAFGGRRRRYHLACHRVPGTMFVVDSFNVAREHDDATMRFLTHMHSDHYGGLTKKSLPDGAKVLCTETTAALAQKILGLPQSRFHKLPLGEPVDVVCSSSASRGATVWAYDSNHCPGAAVLLFRIWATGEWVLHSGDCRFLRTHFAEHEQLARIVKQGDLGTLYLDTTYAQEAYDFPPQAEVLAALAKATRFEDERTGGKALFFCGSYTIGKERVVQTIADTLGDDVRIFAESRKRGILRAADLGERFNRRITEKVCEARIFVVPMGALRPDGIRGYAAKNRLDPSFIGRALAVAVRPTGWSYKPGTSAVRTSVRSADQAVVFSVAYSEHSSLSELRDFVSWAKPKRIVPTVGGQTEEKRRKLAELVRQQPSALGNR